MYCVSLHRLNMTAPSAKTGKARLQMSSPLHLSAWLFTILISILGTLFTGCARLPETTKVLYDSDHVVIKLETDFNAPSGSQTNPIDISTEQLTGLLRGFSVRPGSRVPIPLLSDDPPPRKLFRETELDAVVPVIREGLQKVGFHERVRFEVRSRGRNPRYWLDVTGGWVKVRDRYFHLHVDYFHVEQPIRKADAYDRNYPTPWTPDQPYMTSFEPGRAYVTDPLLDEYAVDLDLFAKSASP
jgi:hypothetical protein